MTNVENRRTTNADRIRKMSDEELSAFLHKIVDIETDNWFDNQLAHHCDNCPYGEDDFSHCKECKYSGDSINLWLLE